MVRKIKFYIGTIGVAFVLLLGSKAFAEPVFPSHDELMMSQMSCVQSAPHADVQLMSADDEQQKPLTHQKLLTILIGFNDIPIKYDCDHWNKKMFSTNPNDISVVNYWKENANGLDIFEPADTSEVQIGREGMVSTEGYTENYTDIKYTIDDFSDGVVKVTLDIPHPTKTWHTNNNMLPEKAAILAIRAVETDFDFTKEKPYIAAIFSGYGLSGGSAISEGKGQTRGHTARSRLTTHDGITLERFTIQGELYNEEYSVGIGTICHELGHSVFNLPDLYFNDAIGATPDSGTCVYSLMSSGSDGHRYKREYTGNSYEEWISGFIDYGEAGIIGGMPPHLDAWSKIQCGFVTPIQTNEWDGNLNSITENGIDSEYNVLEIRSSAAPNQCFLVENRQLIGYDRGVEEANNYYSAGIGIYINGGIIIWHIDESINNVNNGNYHYHPFMWAERSTNEWAPAYWAYDGTEGRNKFNSETTPNSNLHQRKTFGGSSCSFNKDCHPQTLESGISIEVLSENSPSMRVKVNVDDEYRMGGENKTFSEIFPDENFCRAILDMIEEKGGIRKTPDSVMSISDWAQIKTCRHLYADDYGIKNLEGLQYFSELVSLHCANNEITEINTELLPDLYLLSCTGNKIEKLDLSKWEGLTDLYCENNLLTELNISGNKYLQTLWCQNNLLTELNTNENTILWDLACYNNKLTGLNFENNPDLLVLECYDNYLDTDDPYKSIKGLEPLTPELGEPDWKDNPDENIYFRYYTQKTADVTPSPSPTPTIEPTASPSPTPTVEPSPTPSLTPTPTLSPTPTPTPSPTPTPTAEPTPTPEQVIECVKITAEYSDGILKSVKTENVKAKLSEIINAENTRERKVFYWKSFESMEPVTAEQKVK